MSVLNTMLGDLERRGHASALSLAPREEAPAPPPPTPPLILISDRRKHPVRLVVVLTALAAAAVAVWLWRRPAPSLVNPPSPARVDAASSAPSALPPTPVAQSPRSELPPLAVERVAPPSLAPGATSDLPALDPQAAAPTPSQPMHPRTPTPRAGLAPDAAESQAADSQSAAASQTADVSATARAESSEGAQSKPAEAANAAKTGEPAVARSVEQSDLTRAMALVARGRSTEAVQVLTAALAQRPAWHEARSALAALQAEAGDRQQALATLLGGATLDPNRFAPMAAQLQAELNDAAGALQTLDRVPTGARDQAYHGLAGPIAQRAGQHERAVAEYAAALKMAPSNSLDWVGLAMSLQALGRDAQALAAYQTAASGMISADVRRFVEARIRAVQASAQLPAAQPR
jgi:Flp pilus assembly protein TadD